MAGYTPPKKGTDAAPQTGMPVIGDRRDGSDPSSPAAQAVVDTTAATLNAWRAAQRQLVATSMVDYHRARFDSDTVEAEYTNHYGQETFSIRPKPVPTVQPEVNAPTRSDAVTPYETSPDRLAQLPPTLYLMVLFKENGIAAIRMDALPQIVADYVSTSSKSTWVAGPGQIHQTMQIKLGQVSWLMLPLDLAGNDNAKTHYLCADSFSTSTDTGVDPHAAPLINGSNSVVYTMGGSYTINDGKLVLQQAMISDGAALAEPAAIDSDGTCYFNPGAVGLCSIVSTAKTEQQLANDLVQKLQAISQERTPVQVYSALYAARVRYAVEYQGYNSKTSYDQRSDIFAVGPQDVYPSTVAYSSFGFGKMGEAPKLATVKAASFTSDQQSYNNGSFSVVSGGQPDTDFSNLFPVMSFTSKSGVALELVNVTATEDDSATLTPNPAANKQVGAIEASTMTNLYYTEFKDSINDYVEYRDTVYFTYFAPGVDQPNQPGITTDSADAYYEKLVALMAAQYGSVTTVNAEQVSTTYTNNPPTLTGSGQYTELPAGQPPNDYISIQASLSVGGSANTQTVSEFSSCNLPLVSGYTIQGGRYCTVTAFGVTMSVESDANSDTPAGSASMTVYPFPLLLNGNPYYTVVTINYNGNTQVTKATLTTPYDTYKVTDQTTFEPWLHVSNSDHVLQGYRVGLTDTHLFLDGDATDLMPNLTQLLNCKVYEVATMVMDVTLDTIKNLSGVKAPSYT